MEFVGTKTEVINGVALVVKLVRYANGIQVKRTYDPDGTHIDSLIIHPKTIDHGSIIQLQNRDTKGE